MATVTTVTIEDFQKANRAPVWKNMWNEWTLLRVGDDLDGGLPGLDDADSTIRFTTAAVMAKWFGTTAAASILDPNLPFEGSTRSGAADRISVIEWGKATGHNAMVRRAAVKRSELTTEQRKAGVSTSREMAPGPLQFIRSDGAPIQRVRIQFVWRSPVESVPWPVWRTALLVQLRSSALDPLVPKDWILETVHKPRSGAPAELTSKEKVEQQILEATDPVAALLEPIGDVGNWKTADMLVGATAALVGLSWLKGLTR